MVLIRLLQYFCHCLLKRFYILSKAQKKLTKKKNNFFCEIPPFQIRKRVMITYIIELFNVINFSDLNNPLDFIVFILCKTRKHECMEMFSSWKRF